MIVQYIFGGLITLLSLIFIVIGIYTICIGEGAGFISILIGIMFTIPGVMIITDEPAPTKQDVFDGKAIYQETQITTGNDTVKTYDIVWKQKN